MKPYTRAGSEELAERRLRMAQLYRDGHDRREIGRTLGLNQPSVSRELGILFACGSLKPRARVMVGGGTTGNLAWLRSFGLRVGTVGHAIGTLTPDELVWLRDNVSNGSNVAELLVAMLRDVIADEADQRGPTPAS